MTDAAETLEAKLDRLEAEVAELRKMLIAFIERDLREARAEQHRFVNASEKAGARAAELAEAVGKMADRVVV